LIENLRKDHDKSSKDVEDLRTNNVDLAKTLSNKEKRIQDLEKALADQRETSGRNISEIINKLKLLFEEYEKSLKNFGVRPAPLPANLGISDFMDWIDTKFKALPGVISSASDFAAVFSVESILKLLHDFDCVDLVKFREKLPQFPDTSSTSRLRPNEDVLAIKAKFAREFWLASGRETAKSIARAKLEQVNFWKALLIFKYSRNFVFLFFLRFLPLLFQLIEVDKRGKDITPPESSFEDEDEDEEANDTDGEGSGDNSSSGNDAEETSEHEENSPKVDKHLPFVAIYVYM
jgi:hypothetical protein